MTTKVLTIAGVPMYSGAPNSTYDDMTNTQMEDYDGGDNTTDNEELSAITGSLILSGEGLTLSHEIEGKSTANLTIKDDDASMHFSERQLFTYGDLDNNYDFAGVISSSQEIKIPGTSYVFHVLDAVDYTAIMDWRIANYAEENILAGDVVKALITTYLDEEGIGQGIIEDGETLIQATLSDKTLAEALDKLAEACGFIWYITYDMKLYFHSRSLLLVPADWMISDGSDILSESFEVTRSNSLYRNIENILGGWEETSTQTESFVGDSTTKTFPVAYKVKSVVNVTIDGSEITSIGEKDGSTSYDFMYGVGSETVTCKVAPAASLVVEYIGLWRAKTQYPDGDLIEANKTRQGFGSGKIEHCTTDETLTDSDAAMDYAHAKVAEYGRDGITVVYKTLREGLAAGTIQTIDYGGLGTPGEGIDCLITKVVVDTVDGVTTYTIEAVSGPVNQSWENFFREQFTTQNFVGDSLTSSAAVSLLFQPSHTYYNADRPDIFGVSYCGVDVQNTTWPCFDVADRTKYIEFKNAGTVLMRKAHTSVPSIGDNTSFISYTFVGASEGNGQVTSIVFYGGDSATLIAGSGVQIYAVYPNLPKSSLQSWQINMTYTNGT